MVKSHLKEKPHKDRKVPTSQRTFPSLLAFHNPIVTKDNTSTALSAPSLRRSAGRARQYQRPTFHSNQFKSSTFPLSQALYRQSTLAYPPRLRSGFAASLAPHVPAHTKVRKKIKQLSRTLKARDDVTLY